MKGKIFSGITLRLKMKEELLELRLGNIWQQGDQRVSICKIVVLET